MKIGDNNVIESKGDAASYGRFTRLEFNRDGIKENSFKILLDEVKMVPVYLRVLHCVF